MKRILWLRAALHHGARWRLYSCSAQKRYFCSVPQQQLRGGSSSTGHAAVGSSLQQQLSTGWQHCSTGRRHCSRSTWQLADVVDATPPPWHLTFLGNDHFALQSLMAIREYMRQGDSTVGELQVVTNAPAPKRTTVHTYCLAQGLPVRHWPLCPADLPGAQLGVVVSFGHLIPAPLISHFPLGMLNVHGSLLPAYRGSAPVIHALLNGDTRTGITVTRILPHRFDVGESLLLAPHRIAPHTCSATLRRELGSLGAGALVRVLGQLGPRLRAAQPQPQQGGSHAGKPQPGWSRVAWRDWTRRQVYQRYLALDDVAPLYTAWRGRRLELRGAVLPDEDTPEQQHLHAPNSSADCHAEQCGVGKEVELISSGLSSKSGRFNLQSLPYECTDPGPIKVPSVNISQFTLPVLSPGQISYKKNSPLLWVGCKDGVIGFKLVKVVKKKNMLAKDFYNGYLSKVNEDERYFESDPSVKL